LAEHPPGGRIFLKPQGMGATGQEVAHVIVIRLLDVLGRRLLCGGPGSWPQVRRPERQTEDRPGQNSDSDPLLPGHSLIVSLYRYFVNTDSTQYEGPPPSGDSLRLGRPGAAPGRV